MSRPLFLAAIVLALAPSVAQEDPAADAAAGLDVTEENARSIERYNEAILAAQQGRLVESIAKLDAFIEADPPESLRSKAAEQLELIRAERRKEHVVEFNEAVTLLKKRELEQAEALLRGILHDGPSEKMQRSVAKQLGIIERAKPRRHQIVDDAEAAPDDTADDEPAAGKKKKRGKRD